MNKSRRQYGFSLIEALLATGILGVGLVLIAMVFPVGVKLTSVAAERTIGAIAADEAFAKMQLWGFPAVWPALPSNQVSADYLMLANAKYVGQSGWPKTLAWDEFFYPSAAQNHPRAYHWSALGRRIDERQAQMTVFVTRKSSADMQYRNWSVVSGVPVPGLALWPSPVPVNLAYSGNPGELKVVAGDNPSWGQDVFGFFGSGSVLVDDRTGKIYHVTEYKASAVPGPRDTLVLRDAWQWDGYEQGASAPTGPLTLRFWVVPPGMGSTRSPVIGVFQKTMTISP